MCSFHSLTIDELKSWFVARQEEPFRALQVLDWVYGKRVKDWQAMDNLPLALRTELAQAFTLSSLQYVRHLDSTTGETTKFLWRLSDGKQVESVLIRSPGCHLGRHTVCVSSQVGCPGRCAFCASGRFGLIRHLTGEEIFEQVYLIDCWLREQQQRVTHVVFMGMGEPLDNYDSVIRAIFLLTDPQRLHLSQRRITISTVGVLEGIERLTKEELKVNLVLSLHAPNQQLRKRIIPYARKYELDDLLDAMLRFAHLTKRDLTYEYTLIAGLNDRPQHAVELAQLVKDHPCTINLIPYNPVDGLTLRRPEREEIEAFRRILVDAGIVTTWRYTKGKEIAAACGQLALQKDELAN